MTGPLPRFRLTIRGMSCRDCEQRVSQALRDAGAHDVEADFRRGVATFRAPADAEPGRFLDAVQAVGYEPGALETVHDVLEPPVRPVRRGGEDGFDLVIVGSGGAGMAAAIRAVEAGARVAMVERGTVGGTCVNVGCVPSKTLLRAAGVHWQARNHPFAGVPTSAGPVDLPRLVGQKDALVASLRQRKYVDLIADYGWELIQGQARFASADELEVDGRRLRARAFLIATGAAPAVPDIPGLEQAGYLTSTTALSLRRLPRRLAVIGAGYIALELGQYFRQLGSEVVLIQRNPRFLHRFEPEVAAAMAEALRDQGVDWIVGVRVRRVERAGELRRLVLEIEGGQRIVETDEVLVAAGRTPNTGDLALDRAGVATGPKGEVSTDGRQRTSNPRVYAAGDVTLGPQFVYVAAHQGVVAAENALGLADRAADLTVVPSVVFTHPGIASVGITEEQARARGLRVRTTVMPVQAIPRALVNRETTGVFKLIADAESGRLLGAHVVAADAGEVIYAAALAVKFGLTIHDLQDTLCPYLTMNEGLRLAAQTFDRDVSKLSCCAS